MPETHQEAKRRDLKKSLQSTFDNVCQLDSFGSIEVSESLPHPFKTIKEKFETASYNRAQEFLNEIDQVAVDLRKYRDQYVNAASELELVLEALRANFEVLPQGRVKHLRGKLMPQMGSQSTTEAELNSLQALIQRYLDVTSDRARAIILDDNDSLDGPQGLAFDDDLTRAERARLLLKWPLPNAEITSNQNSTASLEDADDKSKHPLFKKTFEIHGSTFTVGVVHISSLIPYTLDIRQSSEIEEEEFTSRYVLPYLQNHDLDDDMDFSSGATFSQMSQQVVSKEEVEDLLEKSLYNTSRILIENSLISQNNKVSEGMMQVIKQRPYIKVEKDSGKSFQLYCRLQKAKSGMQFLGTSSKPDLQSGYYATTPDGMLAVYLTTIGEIKYPTFELEKSIKELKEKANSEVELEKPATKKQTNLKTQQDLTMNHLHTNPSSTEDSVMSHSDMESDPLNITQLPIGEDETESPSSAEKKKDSNSERETESNLEKVLRKYCSICITLGITRFIISDYNSFAFFRLRLSKKALEKQPAKEEANLSSVQHITAEYSLFPRSLSGIRLLFLSFFITTPALLDEITAFREGVSGLLEKHLKSLKGYQARQASRPTSKESGSIQAGETDTGNQKDDNKSNSPGDANVEDSDDTLHSQADTPNSEKTTNQWFAESANMLDREFNSNLFKEVSYVSIGNTTINEVISIGHAAQVVIIDYKDFARQIFEENHRIIPSAEKAILKVFDPIIGEVLEYDEYCELVPGEYSYQMSINYTVSEVKSYILLQEYAGDFLPQLYAYGRLADLSGYIGEPYLRLTGGYIVIEKFEQDEMFRVNRDFFDKVILKLFEKIHAKNVIHGKIERNNFIFTTDGKFKIVDFSLSRFSTSAEEKAKEIRQLYSCFFRVA